MGQSANESAGPELDPLGEDVESILARLRESEARYRLLVDMLPQQVWTTDPSGYHTYFSRRWYDFTGTTLEDARGEGWSGYLHPDDRERTVERWQHSLRTGEPYSIEYRFRGADGSYRWFLGQAVPRRDESGAIAEWFGTLTDISERKRLDEERETMLRVEHEARAQVTTILESITDAFFAIDREWRFTYVNGEAERLLERSRDELLGRDLWREFPAAIGAGFEREYRRAMEERVTVRFEEYFAPLEGWFDVRAFPTADGLSVFFTNVTDRKTLDDERERLLARERDARAEAERRREELEVVTESRTRLMRGFSHDVKNPLGAANGYAQLLEDGILGPLAPRQVDGVQRMRRNIRTALELIDELLELARAEAGQLELAMTRCDVAQLAREAAEDFRAQAAGGGLAMEVRVDGPLTTETDPVRVRQVLSNLLSNAVKYTRHGCITVEASCCRDDDAPRAGEWLAIRVTDTGPGIPPSQRERIFLEFTRLDPDAQYGAGVGLAISRRIACLLGGDITVESEEGKGSTFTLWLPAGSDGGGGV